MKYLIRQKVFSFGDNFTIKDENQVDRFIVRGKVFSFGDKLRIFDMAGNELVYIEQKLFRFLPEYNIYYKNQLYATVKREFTFFKPRFKINSSKGIYTMEGNIWGYNFTIFKDGKQAMEVSKKWFSWGDTYGVDIFEEEDHPFFLALAIVIDQVLHDGNHNNN